MFVCDSKDNKTYLRDTNETIFAGRLRVFIKKPQITEQHGTTEREFCVYLTFWFSIFTKFNRQEVMFVCDSKDNKSNLRDTNETIFGSRWRVFMKKKPNSWAAWNYRTWVFRLPHVSTFIIHLNGREELMFVCDSKDKKAIFATPTKQFLLPMKSFHEKNQITEQHGITERQYCVYLTFSFSLFTSFNRQEVMFVCDSKDNKTYFATLTEQFLLADEEFSSEKLKQLSSMELQNVSFAFISRFHFQNPPHSTDRKWCLFAIQKITKAIFATPTKQFLLADEEFSSKTSLTQQHGITEREYCVYLTFSFSLFTSFNRQEVMFVCDSKDNKSYLRDTNKTNFASRWRVFFKNPHNSAAWKYRTWVLRLPCAFIFIIHLIQQTGSDVCLRFKR